MKNINDLLESNLDPADELSLNNCFNNSEYDFNDSDEYNESDLNCEEQYDEALDQETIDADPITLYMADMSKHNILAKSEYYEVFAEIEQSRFAIQQNLFNSINVAKKLAELLEKNRELAEPIAKVVEMIDVKDEPFYHGLDNAKIIRNNGSFIFGYFVKDLQNLIQKWENESPFFYDYEFIKMTTGVNFSQEVLKTLLDVKQQELKTYHSPNLSAKINNEISLIKKEMRKIHRAKEKIIHSNLRLVFSVAKKYSKEHTFVRLADLIQEGNIGLIRAIEKFQYQKGFEFTTYATPWVQQAIFSVMTDHGLSIRVPSNVVAIINKIKRHLKINDRSLNELAINVEELSKEINEPVEKIERALSMNNEFLSIDMTIVEDSDTASLSDILADDSMSQEDLIYEQEKDQELNRILEKYLSPKEITIICKRFGLRNQKIETLEGVSKYLELTKERVRQIESKALQKLSQLVKTDPAVEMQLREILAHC